jgi:hypothetical protein
MCGKTIDVIPCNIGIPKRISIEPELNADIKTVEKKFAQTSPWIRVHKDFKYTPANPKSEHVYKKEFRPGAFAQKKHV